MCIRLKDTTDNYVTKGIFIKLQASINLEWFTTDMANTLDFMFYTDRGNKIISPMFVEALKRPTYNDAMAILVKLITMKYKDSWNKMYQAYFGSNYNPLTNFKSVEDEGVATDLTQTSNVNNKRYGFNTGSQGKDTDSGVNSVTTTGDITKNKRHREVSGITGKTNQEMIREELELRQMDFYDIIIKNVDKELLVGLWAL